MKNNQKGIVGLLIVLALIVTAGVFGGYLYWIKNKTSVTYDAARAIPSAYLTDYKQSVEGISTIGSSTDLKTASATVDKLSVTDIDAELNELESESSF